MIGLGIDRGLCENITWTRPLKTHGLPIDLQSLKMNGSVFNEMNKAHCVSRKEQIRIRILLLDFCIPEECIQKAFHDMIFIMSAARCLC